MSVDGIVSDMMLELCVEICVLDFLNESLRSGCRVRGAQDGTAHYDIVGAGRDRVGDSHRSSLVVGWTRGAPYPRGNNDEIRPRHFFANCFGFLRGSDNTIQPALRSDRS